MVIRLIMYWLSKSEEYREWSPLGPQAKNMLSMHIIPSSLMGTTKVTLVTFAAIFVNKRWNCCPRVTRITSIVLHSVLHIKLTEKRMKLSLPTNTQVGRKIQLLLATSQWHQFYLDPSIYWMELYLHYKDTRTHSTRLMILQKIYRVEMQWEKQ